MLENLYLCIQIISILDININLGSTTMYVD
nr:MAG TPA: hypothetical protein [Bacteriophage sp.]